MTALDCNNDFGFRVITLKSHRVTTLRRPLRRDPDRHAHGLSFASPRACHHAARLNVARPSVGRQLQLQPQTYAHTGSKHSAGRVRYAAGGGRRAGGTVAPAWSAEPRTAAAYGPGARRAGGGRRVRSGAQIRASRRTENDVQNARCTLIRTPRERTGRHRDRPAVLRRRRRRCPRRRTCRRRLAESLLGRVLRRTCLRRRLTG
jgi:hypothetical protein